MSNEIVITITDSNGQRKEKVEAPATICITWRLGRIGTIVIEDFRLGTPYSHCHGEIQDSKFSVGGIIEPNITIDGSKPIELTEKKFHIIPDGKGGFQIYS